MFWWRCINKNLLRCDVQINWYWKHTLDSFNGEERQQSITLYWFPNRKRKQLIFTRKQYNPRRENTNDWLYISRSQTDVSNHINSPRKYFHIATQVLYVKETLLSRSNWRQARVEKSPAKPFDKQPSTAQGDLEEHSGLLCLTISMQSSVVFPGGLSSSFANLWAVSLILLKLRAGSRSVEWGKTVGEDSISSCWRSSGNFLFKPGNSFSPATKAPSLLDPQLIFRHIKAWNFTSANNGTQPVLLQWIDVPGRGSSSTEDWVSESPQLQKKLVLSLVPETLQDKRQSHEFSEMSN